MGPNLPQVGDGDLHLGELRLQNSRTVLEVATLEQSLGAAPEVEARDAGLQVRLGLEPAHHRMVVGLSH